jgi:hypothetical protein
LDERGQQNVKTMMGRFIIRTPNVVGDNFVAVGSNNLYNGQIIQVMLELDLNEQSYLFMFWMRVLLLIIIK